jgi:hypothetical protein
MDGSVKRKLALSELIVYLYGAYLALNLIWYNVIVILWNLDSVIITCGKDLMI